MIKPSQPIFQSTLPAGGATPIYPSAPGHRSTISIHAPRGGSDQLWRYPRQRTRKFQSTLPAGGATRWVKGASTSSSIFQSTLPAGGATLKNLLLKLLHHLFQSTLPAGGATFRSLIRPIHAPKFQSTLPAGGATRKGYDMEYLYVLISIHAPRGGSDPLGSMAPVITMNISIHAPRGGSDVNTIIDCGAVYPFQSTLPAGGATPAADSTGTTGGDFNPRSPRGERPGNRPPPKN